MGEPHIASFSSALVGEQAYTYRLADGEMIGDFGWVTDLEFFDERFGEIVLTRQCWQLVGESTIVLSDPFGDDE